VFAAVATGSFAADLPIRSAAPPPYIAPIFTWTGFYVGANVGGVWTSSCRNISPFVGGVAIVGWAAPACGSNDGSFIGGVQAGYNFQSGAFVYGIEADIQGMSNKNNAVAWTTPVGVGVLPPGTYLLAGSRNPNTLGTVRLRLGYAVDRALFYITGGLAYGSGTGSASITHTPVGGGAADAVWAAGSGNSSGVGWTLGAGMEYAFTNNWTAKIEYLYANLGNNNSNAVACTGVACVAAVTWNGTSRNANVNVVRVGVNYKF